MMKFLVGFCILAVVAPAVYGDLKCSAGKADVPEAWIDMHTNCLLAMRDQIQMEINASYKYLALAAHFAQDTVNRPGFADLFFKAAKEEREHGSKLIEYLSMRGQLTNSVSDLITPPASKDLKLKNAADALKFALNLETEVTTSIRNLIRTCEANPSDYHLVDYLTGVFLEEQLHGQRELAGKLSTLSRMMKNHGALGEFLFDKEL